MVYDKEGNKLTWKEFFSRWKEGIKNLTPEQKLTQETRGTFITLLGYIVSLIAVIWFSEKIGLLSYGLMLIFIGSIWSAGITYISKRQQLKLFKDTDNKVLNSINELYDMLNEDNEVKISNTGVVKKGMSESAIKTEELLADEEHLDLNSIKTEDLIEDKESEINLNTHKQYKGWLKEPNKSKEYKDSKELLNDLKSGKIKEGEEVILDETKEKKDE